MAKIYFAAFTAFFFLRNIFMPLAQDDYAYAFIWEGDKGGNLSLIPAEEELQKRERVQSFGDILTSQYSHYFTWGGRIVAHSIAQFFLWIGKPYFDVANTLVLALLVIVIFKLADVSLKNIFAVVWAFTCILFFIPESVVTIIWLTGSCNYLWMSLLQLSFVLPYVKAFRKGAANDSALKIFAMALLGLLAGWSNEAGALATIFLTAIFIFKAKQKNFLTKYMLAGFATLVTGCALNILSPGNFLQTQFIQSVNPAEFTFSPEMLRRHFILGFLPIIAVDFFILLPLIYYFFKRGFKAEFLPLAFVAAGFLVPSAMMFSPKFDLRVSIISVMFLLVATIWAFPKIKINLPSIVVKGAALIMILYSATIIYTDFSTFRAVNENIAYIRQHQKDNPLIMAPLKISRTFEKIQAGKIALTWIEYFGGINENPNFYLNVMVAQYYGVKRIVADKQ